MSTSFATLADPTSSPAAASLRATRRSPQLTPMVALIAVLLVAELAVRVEASRLAAPVLWLTPEAQVKVERMQALRRAHQTDGVVFLSSSVLDVGVDPVAFAAASGTRLPVYNGSLSGANAEELRWWADRVVVPLLRPKLIVVGLSSREINANDPQATQLAAQFFAAPAVRRIDGRETVMQRLERYGEEVSSLFRYRKSLRNVHQIIHQDAEIQVQRRYFSSPQGQELALAAQPFRHDLDAVFRATFVKNFAVSASKLGVISGLLEDLRATGARVILADAPVTQEYIDLHPGKAADFAAYEAAMARTAGRLGLSYLAGATWDTTYFADPLHLNALGAQRFSGELAERLRPGLDVTR